MESNANSKNDKKTEEATAEKVSAEETLQEVKKEWLTPEILQIESSETSFGGPTKITDSTQPFSSSTPTPS